MSEMERPGAGFALLSATPQTGIRGVLVAAAGDMSVQLADGSDNSEHPVAVVVGQFFPLQALCTASGNTAILLGVK